MYRQLVGDPHQNVPSPGVHFTVLRFLGLHRCGFLQTEGNSLSQRKDDAALHGSARLTAEVWDSARIISEVRPAFTSRW